MFVYKRDGRLVKFDRAKIIEAILKAFNEVQGYYSAGDYDAACEIADYVESLNADLSVERIQDIVEEKLMGKNQKVAKAYIIYRNDRNRARQRNSTLMKDIKSKILATNVQNQNANVDEKSFGGRFGEAAEVVLKQFALDELVSDTARFNHINNRVYIHDFGHYALGDHNCLTIPFDELLANGFDTRQTDVRPANSINTAFQLVAVIFQLQSLQQFGGVAAGHLDWTMVPYVRKSFWKHYKDGLKYIAHEKEDKDWSYDHSIEDDRYKKYPNVYSYAMDMTVKELEQAVEGMYHNLNN